MGVNCVCFSVSISFLYEVNCLVEWTFFKSPKPPVFALFLSCFQILYYCYLFATNRTQITLDQNNLSMKSGKSCKNILVLCLGIHELHVHKIISQLSVMNVNKFIIIFVKMYCARVEWCCFCSNSIKYFWNCWWHWNGDMKLTINSV